MTIHWIAMYSLQTITIPQFQRNKEEELTLLFKDFRRVSLDWDEKLKDYFNR